VLRFSRTSALALLCVSAVLFGGCAGQRSLLPGYPGVTSQNAGVMQAGKFTQFQKIKNQPPTGILITFLMTDGSVLAQSSSNWRQWYRYRPDSSGSYANGSWSNAASLPAGYAPDAFAAATQIDGRFIISGGEYNSYGSFTLQLTNLGAVYDPVADTWTAIGHPHRWHWIGDSPSSVLPDGRYLLGDKLHPWDAALNPKTLKWTEMHDVGKSDFNAEEGWTLLPNGTVLTADVKNAPNSEIYDPSKQTWTSAGSTIVDLHSPSPYKSCLQYGPKSKDCYLPPGEIGPAILRPDGTVFYTGSASGKYGSGVGHTAIYNTSNGKWSVGPDFPNGDSAGDSWGVLLPNGNALIFGSSGMMYEFNGSTWSQDGYASGSPLLLPTGQVLMVGYSVVLFTPTGSPKSSWAPAIASVSSRLTPGKTYKITGTQFNGLSQAMSFGDEYQNPTNYPLVRITNNSTKHVFYARTHDHSTMGVATGSQSVSTNFDVPKTIDKGKSTLVVVANGIASKPVNVTIK